MAKKKIERCAIDADERNANWLNHLPKKKKTQEAMEPFKPQDGDQLQKPRVLPVEDHNAAPRSTGKMNPRGYGASKKERI